MALWPWAVAALVILFLHVSGIGAFLGDAMSDMSKSYNDQYSLDDDKEEEKEDSRKKDK